MGNVNITGNAPTILNPYNPKGLTVSGKSTDGTIWQYNNGRDDLVNIGASQNGSIKEVIAADAGDTINLTGGWTDKGSAVDINSKIAGRLFKDQKGDEILISGNAHLTGDYTGTSDSPTKSPVKPVVQSKSVVLKLGKGKSSVKTGSATLSFDKGPAISKADLTKDMNLIKADLQNAAIEKQKPTPNCVTQQEILNSITDEVLPDADKAFWRNTAKNFNLIDGSGKGGTKNDGLINIEDITGSGYATVN